MVPLVRDGTTFFSTNILAFLLFNLSVGNPQSTDAARIANKRVWERAVIFALVFVLSVTFFCLANGLTLQWDHYKDQWQQGHGTGREGAGRDNHDQF